MPQKLCNICRVCSVAKCVREGIMVRLLIILLSSILISSTAFAFPKPGIAEGPAFIVRVEEPASPYWESSEGFRSSELGKPDCRHYTPQNSPAECAAYWRAAAARDQEKRAAALAKENAARAQAERIKQANKKAAARALSEHERNVQAAKPLAPAGALAPVKAVPGKTPEERLRHMVGQLVLTGFSGRQPEDADVERIAREVRDGKVSGVILRDSNVANAQQLRRLLSVIATAGAENPALIAIDQPGGSDTVLSEDKGFAFYSAANAVSSASSPYEAQLLYRAMASELAALGVTLNIGPSEDICREDGVNLSAFCFGTSPSRIAAFARAFNFGHHDRGVLTALRHTPFQGGLRTTWISERASMAIVHRLVKGETSDALVVRVKAMEPLPLTDVSFGLPSRKVKSRDNRGFGFDGALIFEMDMGSGGAPLRYSEVILRAFQAGADMVLLREPSSVRADISGLTLEAVQAGLKSGRLQLARVEDAYRRVQRLKARLRTFPSRTKIAGLDRESAPSHSGGVE